MSSLAKRVIMPRDEPHGAEEARAEELRLLEAMLFASAEPHRRGKPGGAAASRGGFAGGA